jgi:hypothetical protein
MGKDDREIVLFAATVLLVMAVLPAGLLLGPLHLGEEGKLRGLRPCSRSYFAAPLHHSTAQDRAEAQRALRLNLRLMTTNEPHPHIVGVLIRLDRYRDDLRQPESEPEPRQRLAR